MIQTTRTEPKARQKSLMNWKIQMLKRTPLTLLLFAGLFSSASSQTSWMGVYVKDQKIGYVSSTTTKIDLGSLTESLSVIDGKMLGYTLVIKVKSKVWSDAQGNTTRLQFDTETGGRRQLVEAEIQSTQVVTTSTMDGRTTSKTIAKPPSAMIVDDPLTPFLHGIPTSDIYVFDPNTLELVKCRPVQKGNQEIDTPTGKTTASVIDVQDPRAPMTIYISSKGDLIKAVGPFGMEMRPVDEKTALAESDSADIALASSIKPDVPIIDFLNTKTLTISARGSDLSKLPSDGHQTVTKTIDGWTIETHPVQPGNGLFTSEKTFDKKWLAPDLHIPSDSEKFKSKAKQLTSGSGSIPEQIEKIREFVHKRVKANGGIGVLRDADDVMESGEGVCRDHAILTATLLRANNIPCRLVSGLVYGNEAFYYHAWVEVWTGKVWLGVDSTRPTKGLDATHIKIAQGTVSDAFTSFLLDGVTIKVIKQS